MCEIKVIYWGPTPFVCNFILHEQHRQANVYARDVTGSHFYDPDQATHIATNL